MADLVRTITNQIGSLLSSSRPKYRPPPSNHILCRTAEEGYGFFPARWGQLIGPGGRYRVLRMLGAGQYSSVLLVDDLQ